MKVLNNFLLAGAATFHSAVQASCATDADCTGSYSTCNTATSACECTATPTIGEIAALDFSTLSTVTCTPSGIKVQVDKCAVDASRFVLSELYLDGVVDSPNGANSLDTSGSNTCVGQETADNGGPFYEFDLATPISDCGTALTTNATHHSFMNTIQGWQGTEGAVITRKRKFFLTFECVYPIQTELSADYAVNALLTEVRFTMDQGDGAYTADFALYEDQAFTTALTTTSDVWVPDFIYGKIVAETPDPDRFVSKLSMCWATPTSDPSDAVNVAFINNGCPVNDIDAAEGSDDIQILVSGTDSTASFALRSFQWADGNVGDEVFIHCIVSLCDHTAGDCTTASCPSRKRRDVSRAPRSTEEEMMLDPITVGGFRMKNAHSCESGGFQACGRFSTCKNSVRFDMVKYMQTQNGWIQGYRCECRDGYHQWDKHTCEPKVLPSIDIQGIF